MSFTVALFKSHFFYGYNPKESKINTIYVVVTLNNKLATFLES